MVKIIINNENNLYYIYCLTSLNHADIIAFTVTMWWHLTLELIHLIQHHIHKIQKA